MLIADFSNKYGGIDMLPNMQKRFAALVISLAVQVISLSGMAFAAAPPPSVTNLTPVTKGLRAPARIVFDGYSTSAGRAHNVYVSDARSGGVAQLNVYNNLVKTIATSGVPGGVAIGTAGTTSGKLLVSQGTYVSIVDPATGVEAGKLGSGVGQFEGADGIAVDAQGYIYVVDGKSATAKIRAFTANGADAGIAYAGGSFYLPTAIVYKKSTDQMVVVDALKGSVFFFSKSGTVLTEIKHIGALAGYNGIKFIAPVAVAFESIAGGQERMYVADAFQGCVRVIDPNVGTLVNGQFTGTQIATIGSYGINPGQLMSPSDVVFDQGRNRLFVTNRGAELVVYGIDGGTHRSEPGAPALSGDALATPVSVATIAASGTVGADDPILGAVSVTVTNVRTGISYSAPVASGAWSVNVALAAGDNILKAVAKYAGGSQDTKIDLTTVSYQPPLGVGVDPLPAFTKYIKLPVTGTADADATVSVCNTTIPQCWTADRDGTSFVAIVDLYDGANHLEVTATKADFTPVTVPADVELDRMGPAMEVSAVAGTSTAGKQLQNVTGTAVDAHLDVVTVNGQVAKLDSGTFSAPVVLSYGPNVITVVARDLAGNETVDQRTVYFDFDMARPVVTIASPVDGAHVKVASATISGTAVDALYLTVGGVPVSVDQSGNWTTDVTLISGMNTFNVQATSINGKVTTEKVTLFFDTVNPELAVTTPARDAATNLPNMTISGTIEAGANLAVETVAGGSINTLTVASGTFSFNIDFTAEGNYPIVLTADDGLGNVTKVIRTIVYDRTAPAVLTIDSKSYRQHIFGTVDPGKFTRVEIKDGANVTVSNNPVLDTVGGWDIVLENGTYDPNTYKVVATDVAGNARVVSPGYAGDGDLNRDCLVNIGDVLVALKTAVSHRDPSFADFSHGDVGPVTVSDTQPKPNGMIDMADVLLILDAAVGKPTVLNPITVCGN
jgi:glucodextranase-like protein